MQEIFERNSEKMISKLEWDSNFFGYNIGRLDSDGESFSKSEIKNFDEFDLVYLFSDKKIDNLPSSRPYVKVIYQFKLENLSDNDISLSKSISEFPSTNYNKKDKKKLRNLAYQSGKYSRFKLDKNFRSDEFNNLYKIWIENSIKGKIADQVLVITNNFNIISGFLTIAHARNNSTIGLIAVDNEYRGKGIGSELISASKYFAINNNSKELLVATQFENKAACCFYQNKGFVEQERVYIYHLWNK